MRGSRACRYCPRCALCLHSTPFPTTGQKQTYRQKGRATTAGDGRPSRRKDPNSLPIPPARTLRRSDKDKIQLSSLYFSNPLPAFVFTCRVFRKARWIILAARSSRFVGGRVVSSARLRAPPLRPRKRFAPRTDTDIDTDALCDARAYTCTWLFFKIRCRRNVCGACVGKRFCRDDGGHSLSASFLTRDSAWTCAEKTIVLPPREFLRLRRQGDGPALSCGNAA